MTKRINLLFLLAVCLLLTGCDLNPNLNIGGSNEGVGTPTVVSDTNNKVTTTSTVIDANSGSTVGFEGLSASYKAGDVAKFDEVFTNRRGGVLTVDNKVRLMNQDQNQPREYAYGSRGTLLVYEEQTQRVSQQVQIPADITPGTYMMNIYIASVNRDNSTILGQNISLSQPVNITK